MMQIATSLVQLPAEWAEEYPDRRPEVEALGHEVMYGDDPDSAEITIVDEDDWDNFLCMEHPSDFRELHS